MPWFPEFTSAVELARQQTRAAGQADPVRQYLTALNSGDSHTLEEVWPGEVVIYDPRAGEIRGHKALKQFIEHNKAWMAEHHVRTDVVATTCVGDRAVVELLAHVNHDGEQLAWPVAVVAESPNDQSVVFRTYCSQWPVDGRRHVRPPILDPGEAHPGDVVGRYHRALEAGDADTIVGTFESDGYVREFVGSQPDHRGADELRSYFTQRLADGGIGLEHCVITDDGVRCVLEYNVVRWGRQDLAPQAGLGVYERAADGLLAAARLYDDVEAPVEQRWLKQPSSPSRVQTEPVPSQSGVNVADLVGQLVALLDKQYVFPDAAVAIGRILTDRLASGSYEAVDSEEALAAAITKDLQSVNGDKHLRLLFHANPIDEDHGEPEADLAEMSSWAALWSAGFPRVERLPGNVGYLRVKPVLFPISVAGDAATAAMTLLADTDALLIDLRSCLGGDPETVTWLCSYLFDEPVELSSFYERASDRTTPTWTLPEVPGRRSGATKPVWLLCSGTTFSGGEALCYDLQQAGRAKVVGERTGGGAHPREAFRVGPHLEATIPVARPINPHSGTNWEGIGVVPDVLVDADQAESTAYQLALEHVATLPSDGYRREVAEEARELGGGALHG